MEAQAIRCPGPLRATNAFGTISLVRWSARIVAVALVYLMVPNSVGMTIDAVHLVAEGHTRHADGDNGHPAPGPEHGCSGPYHQCACHSSLPIAPSGSPEIHLEPVGVVATRALEEARAPWSIDLETSERPPSV